MLSKTGSTFGGYIAEFEGISAHCWSSEELSAEVRSGRYVFLGAFRWNDLVVCLPVHQDISDAHISSIVGAVAEKRKGLL